MAAWESARSLPCCSLPAIQVLFYSAHGKVHPCLASTHGHLKSRIFAGCGVSGTSSQEETLKLLQELGDIIQRRNPQFSKKLWHMRVCLPGDEGRRDDSACPTHHQVSWLPLVWGIAPRRGKPAGFIL